MTTNAFALVREGRELRFRRAVLAERVWETPEYVRVRLRGDELAGFDSRGSDDHIRVFFPDAPADSVAELRQAPSREYTPRAWGADWLDIEFFVHGAPGHRGVAAEWAASAPLGAPVGVGGPRGSMVFDGAPDAWLLAGDETAVPAMRRFAAEAMPEDARGRVIVEISRPGAELEISTPHGVEVTYVYRGGDAAGTALARELDGLGAGDRPVGSVFAFVAAEQGIVRPARALVLDRWAVAPEYSVIKGYWKRGETEYHAPH